MALSETERRRAGVQVVPLIVCKCDPKCSIFIPIAVRVSHQRRLPVVVQVRVRDCDTVASVGDVEQAIVVVLVVVPIGREIDVIDPNAVSLLDSDGVTCISQHFADLQREAG